MKKLIFALILFVAPVFLLESCSNNSSNQKSSANKGEAIVTVISKADFFTTVNKLQASIVANNLILLKEYNLQAMMKMVGTDIDPFNLYQIFQPKYGKILLDNDPDAFASTPLSIMIKQDGNKVKVIYRKPSNVYGIFNLPSSFTDKLDKLFAKIAAGATE